MTGHAQNHRAQRNQVNEHNGSIAPENADSKPPDHPYQKQVYAFTLALLIVPTLQTEGFTGSEALNGCVEMLSVGENPDTIGHYADGLSAGYCVGLLEGARFIADTTELLQLGKLVCVPPHLNDMQVVLETTQYLLNRGKRKQGQYLWRDKPRPVTST